MGRLDGRVVLVTGAAGGTGEGVARRAVEEGARVLVTDVREEAGRAVAGSLGREAAFQPLDVARETDWHAAIAACLDAFGRLDGLVNNAALLHMGPIEKTSVDTMQALLAVNVLGPLLGTKAVTAPMRSAGGGSIVNIASIEALGGMNSVATYTATKWALRGFTKSAALELGRDGIRVNCLCPGSGNPDMARPFFEQVDLKRYFEKRQPPVLMEGNRPAEVHIAHLTPAICFLLSDESSRITGAELAVDAGWTAGHYCPGLPGF